MVLTRRRRNGGGRDRWVSERDRYEWVMMAWTAREWEESRPFATRYGPRLVRRPVAPVPWHHGNGMHDPSSIRRPRHMPMVFRAASAPTLARASDCRKRGRQVREPVPVSTPVSRAVSVWLCQSRDGNAARQAGCGSALICIAWEKVLPPSCCTTWA